MGHGALTYPDQSEIEGTSWGCEHHIARGQLKALRSGYRYEGEIVDYREHGTGTLFRMTNDTAARVGIVSGKFEYGVLQTHTRHQLAEELGLIEVTSHVTSPPFTR